MKSELIAVLAREVLGLPAADEAGLAKTARRVEALVAEARRLDQTVGVREEPAVRFAPSPGTARGDSPERPATLEAGRPTERVSAALRCIAERDGEIHAFVAVMADEAMAEARRLEEAGAPAGPLHGMPVAVKDVIDVAGQPTRAGSAVLSDQPARADAEVVRRLRAAGAVLIGKTATHEFAYGSTTPGVHNPVNLTRSPGGSSGGSAAAVAAGMAEIALGTDTGGSVRGPAACCGVVGLKPTYGRVSAAGILPLAWSLDHPGVIARTVSNAARGLAALTDGFTVPAPAPDMAGITVGVPANWLRTPMAPGVSDAFQTELARMHEKGAHVVEVELPPLELFDFVSRVIILAEAAACHTPYLDRLAGYGPDVRAKVELGHYVLARDYLLAQRLRSELCRRTAGVINQVTVLVTPAMPVVAPVIGVRTWQRPDGTTEPVADAMLRFLAPFNVTGMPAISLPCRATAEGMPVGLQVVGPVGGDELIVQIAEALEQNTPGQPGHRNQEEGN